MKNKQLNLFSVIFLFALFLQTQVHAQQRPLYSQYMLNQYIINPAYTGSNDYFTASTNYRYQWVGFTDAPRTYALTVHGPNNSQSFGFGGSLYNDVTGPTSKSGAYLSGAYHFNVTSDQKVSLGLSGGIMQYKVDGTKVTVFDPGDQVLSNARMTTLLPDFGAGVYWYKKDKFYLGLSVPQFINSRISFSENNVKSLSALTAHYFMNGAYTFNLGDNFDIEPSALVKYSHPTEIQLDVGTRVIFKRIFWLGAVYRTEDAISALVGFTTPDDQLSFGYSYDVTRTNVANYSFGTHELMVTAKFGKKKGYRSKGKAKKSEFEKLKEKFEEIELEEQEKEQREKEQENKIEELKQELKTLEKEDKALRDRIRYLREQATVLGFQSAKDPEFGRSKEYLKTLNEIKRNYSRRKAIESELNK